MFSVILMNLLSKSNHNLIFAYNSKNEKMKLFIPENYSSLLNVNQTEQAIKMIKDFFQLNLAAELNLLLVTAPMFVKWGT